MFLQRYVQLCQEQAQCLTGALQRGAHGYEQEIQRDNVLAKPCTSAQSFTSHAPAKESREIYKWTTSETYISNLKTGFWANQNYLEYNYFG